MAKGRTKNWGKRVTNDNSNRRLRFPKLSLNRWSPKNYLTRKLSEHLRPYEDRRQWHPEGANRPARSFTQTRHRLVPRKSSLYLKAGFQNPVYTQKLFDTIPIGIGFRTPGKVIICVRRKERREVMFATKKAGKGGQRTRHLNEYSGVKC